MHEGYLRVSHLEGEEGSGEGKQKAPQLSAMKLWISSFQNIVWMEYLTAKLNKAKQKTIRNWENLYDSIQEL